MNGDGTRATTGAVARADATVAPSWPDRETWAEHRRTAYGDDVDKVLEAVSENPADYATQAEITQASAELGDLWRNLGNEVREANRAALAVWPLHGHRARRRASIHAILRDRERLSEADEALVAHAEALKHHRQLVNAAVDQITGADGVARLHLWTVDNAERWMPAKACPTWRTIVARWKQARAQAAIEYADHVQQFPVDDMAWRVELDRRALTQIARVRGHLGGGR